MISSDSVTEAWRAAAADPGIAFVGPFELADEERKIRYAGLVRDFGSAKGMLIFVTENWQTEPWASVAQRNGFGYSCLSERYANYDRDEFIAALDDWQWTPRDRQPPSWYSGTPWSR